ncbi:MAG: caspase family protein [Saprospiraceae bacterium]
MKHFILIILSISLANLLTAQCISGDCNSGYGTYLYKDGTKYIGNFKDSKAHGEGACYYVSGNKDRYIGEWANHQYNGKGVLVMKSGDIKRGIWQRGKLVRADKENSDKSTKIKVSEKTTEKVKRPKVYAVVVGVARYLHMQSLNYTDDDAYRMYAFLKSPEGGALADNQLVIMVDESATRNKIIKNMEEVFGRATEDDMVLFYFSGHGEKEGLLPIDYNGYDNVLEHKTISKILNKTKAKYKICITDACYSGTMEETISKAKNVKEETDRISQLYKNPLEDFNENSLALLVSSKSEETSVENAGLRQGIFSHFLLRALKGAADTNEDDVVTLGETYEYVAKNVKYYTSEYQTPIMIGENVKKELIMSVIKEKKK